MCRRRKCQQFHHSSRRLYLLLYNLLKAIELLVTKENEGAFLLKYRYLATIEAPGGLPVSSWQPLPILAANMATDRVVTCLCKRRKSKRSSTCSFYIVGVRGRNIAVCVTEPPESFLCVTYAAALSKLFFLYWLAQKTTLPEISIKFNASEDRWHYKDHRKCVAREYWPETSDVRKCACDKSCETEKARLQAVSVVQSSAAFASRRYRISVSSWTHMQIYWTSFDHVFVW